MTVNHKPATPLPWKIGEDRRGTVRIFGPDGIECARALWVAVKTKAQREQQRDYIAHAANAYPRLITALKVALGGNQIRLGMSMREARDVLTELGEDDQ